MADAEVGVDDPEEWSGGMTEGVWLPDLLGVEPRDLRPRSLLLSSRLVVLVWATLRKTIPSFPG